MVTKGADFTLGAEILFLELLRYLKMLILTKKYFGYGIGFDDRGMF